MSSDIIIHKINESKIKIETNQGILREISERFTFDVPGAKFMPSYKSRHWDGKMRLIDSRNSTTFTGLHSAIEEFANERSYSYEAHEDLQCNDEISLTEANEFIKSLKLPVVPHEHQIRAFTLAVRNKRSVLISPTASGKSLIAYMIARWYNVKTLIIVPTISLVAQLAKDFISYGYEDTIHQVVGGVEKETTGQITISTWQSMYNMPQEFFSDFEVVIGDEAHLFKAKSLTSIMGKMINTQYRFGMTGTLDGAQVHELVLLGLFGKVERIIQTSELIDSGKLASINIKIIVLKHPKQNASDRTYSEELEYIISNHARNKFITNLALSLKGNTLLLYTFVEKHGQILYDMILEKNDSTHSCYFVSGGVDGDERENIRSLVEGSSDSITVGSFGTLSTGINIRNLHNIIFASPTKSRIRTLQSIGRGLRVSDTKVSCKLFDIADDISLKNKKNFTLNHLIERVRMYNEESFPYQMYTIKLKDYNE